MSRREPARDSRVYIGMQDLAIKVVVSFDGSQLGVYWMHRRGSLRAHGSLRTLWIGEARDVTVSCAAPELPAQRFPLLRDGGGCYKLLCPEALLDGRLRIDEAAPTMAGLCLAGLVVPCADYPGVLEIELRSGMTLRLKLGLLEFCVKACTLPRRLALAPPWRLQPHVPTVFLALLAGAVAALASSVPRSPIPLWGAADFEPHIALTLSPIHGSGDGTAFVPANFAGAGRISFSGGNSNGSSRQRSAGAPLAGKAAKARVSGASRSAAQKSEGALAALLAQKSVLGDAEATMAALQGGDVGDGDGGGGALVGTVGGGAGDGTLLLGELGSMGRSMGRGSAGATCGASGCRSRLWGAVSTCGRSTCYSPGAPSIEAGAAVSCGTSRVCDKELIRRVVRRHLNEVRYCYERALLSRPNLEGRVGIRFTIAPDGHVGRSEAASSTLEDPAVGSCIAEAVRRWDFPIQRRLVEVNYPFHLQMARELG